jgi:hypothetical protein
MKILFIFLFFLHSSLALCAPRTWSELEIGDIGQTSLRATLPNWDLPPASKLEIQDIVGLEYIHVVIYVTTWTDCSRGDQVAEVDVFDYADSNGEEIGVGLSLDKCQINIFVETKDLSRETFF